MRGGLRTAVVIPARNEERLLPAVLAGLPAWIDDVIVVDDGSTDRTRRIVQAWSDPRRVLVPLTPGRGVGGAILAGYRQALVSGADVTAVVAADGQMRWAELPTVVDPVCAGAADYVQGTRFPGSRLRGRMPLLRRVGNRILSRLTAWAARHPVSDSQCGYTAASRPFLESALRLTLPPGYGFPAFLRVHAHRSGWRIVERPVTSIYGEEVSGIRFWRDPARIAWRLVRLGLPGKASRAPAHRPVAEVATKTPTLRRAT